MIRRFEKAFKELEGDKLSEFDIWVVLKEELSEFDICEVLREEIEWNWHLRGF